MISIFAVGGVRRNSKFRTNCNRTLKIWGFNCKLQWAKISRNINMREFHSIADVYNLRGWTIGSAVSKLTRNMALRRFGVTQRQRSSAGRKTGISNKSDAGQVLIFQCCCRADLCKHFLVSVGRRKSLTLTLQLCGMSAIYLWGNNIHIHRSSYATNVLWLLRATSRDESNSKIEYHTSSLFQIHSEPGVLPQSRFPQAAVMRQLWSSWNWAPTWSLRFPLDASQSVREYRER